jgi:hypothetical protein
MQNPKSYTGQWLARVLPTHELSVS